MSRLLNHLTLVGTATLLCAALAGCSDCGGEGETDAGTSGADAWTGGTDANRPDTATPPTDAAQPPTDAAQPDTTQPPTDAAQPPTDAAQPDTTQPPTDAGPPLDAGPPYAPPAGPYLLISPVVTSQGEEDNRMSASAQFTLQVRVGHVETIQSFGLVVDWDPAALTHVDSQRIDTWLTADGQTILPLASEVDAEAGTLTILFGLTGGTATTATSEAIYEITFDFATPAASTFIAVDSSSDGLVQEGASAPVEGVTGVGLTLN